MRHRQSHHPYVSGVISTLAATGQPIPQFSLLTLYVLVEQSVTTFQFKLRPLHHALDQYVRFRVKLIDLVL